MRIRFIFGALILPVLFAAPALRADEPTPSPLRRPAIVSLQAWGDANAACAEWTNGCAVCARNEHGVAACSTPGIACQPKAIACSRQARRKP